MAVGAGDEDSEAPGVSGEAKGEVFSECEVDGGGVMACEDWELVEEWSCSSGDSHSGDMGNTQTRFAGSRSASSSSWLRLRGSGLGVGVGAEIIGSATAKSCSRMAEKVESSQVGVTRVSV